MDPQTLTDIAFELRKISSLFSENNSKLDIIIKMLIEIKNHFAEQ